MKLVAKKEKIRKLLLEGVSPVGVAESLRVPLTEVDKIRIEINNSRASNPIPLFK